MFSSLFLDFKSEIFHLVVPVVRHAWKARFPGDGHVPPAPSHTKLDSPGSGDGPFKGVHVAHHVRELSESLSVINLLFNKPPR